MNSEVGLFLDEMIKLISGNERSGTTLEAGEQETKRKNVVCFSDDKVSKRPNEGQKPKKSCKLYSDPMEQSFMSLLNAKVSIGAKEEQEPQRSSKLTSEVIDFIEKNLFPSTAMNQPSVAKDCKNPEGGQKSEIYPNPENDRNPGEARNREYDQSPGGGQKSEYDQNVEEGQNPEYDQIPEYGQNFEYDQNPVEIHNSEEGHKPEEGQNSEYHQNPEEDHNCAYDQNPVGGQDPENCQKFEECQDSEDEMELDDRHTHGDGYSVADPYETVYSRTPSRVPPTPEVYRLPKVQFVNRPIRAGLSKFVKARTLHKKTIWSAALEPEP